ncbi:hypothetical protein NDU88_005164 [Pleurodeles waltl]|uniref:Uncharacterized protein n=1 Tax=Pleurodeles waltl TaxID=8319 RepID=A0AAV7L1K1_PLEWA|nr:hypothetical protein NDU88_005164 [Pleurodeles waltl]
MARPLRAKALPVQSWRCGWGPGPWRTAASALRLALFHVLGAVLQRSQQRLAEFQARAAHFRSRERPLTLRRPPVRATRRNFQELPSCETACETSPRSLPLSDSPGP